MFKWLAKQHWIVISVVIGISWGVCLAGILIYYGYVFREQTLADFRKEFKTQCECDVLKKQ